jgi:CheY-like chemotaxis protein
MASCLILSKMLTSLGYQCDIVHTVADGLRAAARKQYSLIIMVCLLPDQTGWVASLLPREKPPSLIIGLIIGILSYPDDEMQSKCASAGMKSVVVKLFSKQEISGWSHALNPQQDIPKIGLHSSVHGLITQSLFMLFIHLLLRRRSRQ